MIILNLKIVVMTGFV